MSGITTYDEALREVDTKIGKPKIVILPGDRMLINSADHGPHDENNPDDGEISEFALRFAEKLKEFGIVSDVHRMG